MEKSINREELKELLSKFDIGKKPLAALLGWGETTIILYGNMEVIPNNEYSRELYRLYTDKNRFRDLLVKNKDTLTGVAYRKAIHALYDPILKSRILTVSQYIIDNCPGVTTEVQLDVILLWSQILSLKFLNKPIFEDIYQPTKGNGNSPYKSVAQSFKDGVFFMESNPELKRMLTEDLTEIYKLDTSDIIDEETANIISFVGEMFSWYGEKAFNSLLAAERFRLCGPPQEKTRRSVSNELLKKIYTDIFDQAKIKKMKDVESFVFKRLETIRKKTVTSSEK